MKLKSIDIIKSPVYPRKVRLAGEVHYDDKKSTELYWFEVDEKYAEYLSDSGNPWLICLLPLAMTLGSRLEIELPIDKVLFENVKKLMLIWKSWYPHLYIVPIQADIVDMPRDGGEKKTAAFFSGGIDSFFTILRHNEEKIIKIDELLTVWGFDIPLKNSKEFHQMYAIFKKSAENLEKNIIDVATNLKETRWKITDWGNFSHGHALASIALALEKRYTNILIASTFGYLNLRPLGSHVLIDPLFSTSFLKFIHDGSEFSRIEKTRLVARSEIARQALHVCWVLGTEKNCSKCSKCFRTMIMLDLFDALDRFITFDRNQYKVKKITKFYCQHDYDYDYMNQIRSLAIEKKRMDLVKAIDDSFLHSKRLNRYMPIAKKFNRYLSSKRFVWRWANIAEKTLVEGSIT